MNDRANGQRAVAIRKCMAPRNLADQISHLAPCAEAVEWLDRKILSTAWRTCRRGDWMLWLAARVGIDRQTVVLAACDCAKLALVHVPAGEDRPQIAIETARRWCASRATTDKVRAANAAAAADAVTHYAAAAARAAAYATTDAAAAYAAVAAAYASDAAVAAADAAAYAIADATDAAAAYAIADATADAVYAANAAAAYAADAAADAARSSTLGKCADLVRARISVGAIRQSLKDMPK